MVLLTQVLGYVKKVSKYLRPTFLDSLRLHLKAGSGGSGLSRYGGKGGAGGNVYVTAKKGINLEKVKSYWKRRDIKAGVGNDSTAKGLLGVPGKDINIEVPIGITIFDENNRKLGELNEDNQTLLVAKGGIGGCSETGYCGRKGETLTMILDLKLIADVGLVGFPNAGKSTLLSVISKAKPKIANYPFTTVRPRLGTMVYHDYRQITIADLPGLIEGAHSNVGMGHKFLKHLERTKLLLFIIDIQGFQLSLRHNKRTCLETIFLLNKEIELYDPDLLNKSSMIIINKMDTNNANEIYAQIKDKLNNLSEFVSEVPEAMRPEQILKFDDIVTTSLISRQNNEIEKIKEKIRNLLDKLEEEKLLHRNEIITDTEMYTKLKEQTRQHSLTYT